MRETIVVTGGAGFIGTNFVLARADREDRSMVVVIDKLTYPARARDLSKLLTPEQFVLVPGNVTDQVLVGQVLRQYQPNKIVHFAAESHVDRSIRAPIEFVETNVVGTFALLEEAKSYWSTLPTARQEEFRFIQVSTDEVYGSLTPAERPFNETNGCRPNSPYAASKAAADHLVRSYHRTYGLPVITARSCNNYGPFQYPEKLIPLTILCALNGRPIPIYGDGQQVRDWIYVLDHCAALECIVERGQVGEVYNVGASTERTNLEVVQTICRILDELRPRQDGASYRSLMQHVADRPGHDRRYAIDATRLRELGWNAEQNFEAGLRETITWYLENIEWVKEVTSSDQFNQWFSLNYSRRPEQ